MVNLDLCGQWEFKEYPLSARRMRDLDDSRWQKAVVPGSIFKDLISQGCINEQDLYENPENYGWVSEKPWVYRKFFDIPENFSQFDRIELVCEGLDTITNIWINDKLIGKTNNMFIPFCFDVTKLLKEKNNCLVIKFESAVEYSNALMKRYGMLGCLNPKHPEKVYVRKALYQFGTDYCPDLPGCGIIRPIILRGTVKARICDYQFETVFWSEKYADVKIALNIDTVLKDSFEAKLKLSDSKSSIEHCLQFPKGHSSHSSILRIEKPSLWNPIGYGEQHLYKLQIKLFHNNICIDRLHALVGIRTAKLVNNTHEKHKTLFMEINGRPVYLKGAAWVHPSIFPCSSKRIENLLTCAADSNINLLRVRADGYYECDSFYENCSRLGIMVWQDFMFDSSYYPERDFFLSDVKKECSAIVKRIRNHPSLVLWCGNNQIDLLHKQNIIGRGKKFYGRTIYHKLLAQMTAELNPTCSYIPSFPLTDRNDSDEEILSTKHEKRHGLKSTAAFTGAIPQISADFGVSAAPKLKTLFTVQTAVKSRKAFEKKCYQLLGIQRIYQYMTELFIPDTNIEKFIYQSQVSAARIAKLHAENIRVSSNNNHGIILDNLADCFPSISASMIDSSGSKKAAAYYARRFFSNPSISIINDYSKTGLEIEPQGAVVRNDSPNLVSATLNCLLMDFWGKITDKISLPVTVSPYSISSPVKLPKNLTKPADKDKVFLNIYLENGVKKTAENTFFYLPDKYINWPTAAVKIRTERQNANKFVLYLETDSFLKDAEIVLPQICALSDNFFDLIPHQTKRVEIIVYCDPADFLNLPIKVNAVNPVKVLL